MDMMLSSTALQMEENKCILRQIVQAIIFLARQGLALRGHRGIDDVLYAHLYKPRALNATYIFPTYHNQIVSVIGNDIILANLIAEMKKAIFFAVLADEVCSHNEEYLPLSICFVDERCNIREEFVAFIS